MKNGIIGVFIGIVIGVYYMIWALWDMDSEKREMLFSKER